MAELVNLTVWRDLFTFFIMKLRCDWFLFLLNMKCVRKYFKPYKSRESTCNKPPRLKHYNKYARIHNFLHSNRNLSATNRLVGDERGETAANMRPFDVVMLFICGLRIRPDLRKDWVDKCSVRSAQLTYTKNCWWNLEKTPPTAWQRSRRLEIVDWHQNAGFAWRC